MEIEWENIEQEVWKPTNENKSIKGKLVGKEAKDNNLGARYYIENESGRYVVWGSVMLDNKMQFVETGQTVRISYEGKLKSRQGQDINNFAVAVPKATPSGQETMHNRPDHATS